MFVGRKNSKQLAAENYQQHELQSIIRIDQLTDLAGCLLLCYVLFIDPSKRWKIHINNLYNCFSEMDWGHTLMNVSFKYIL